MSSPLASPRSPWSYIPTAYFLQGLPFVLVNTTSTLLFKDLGLSNVMIGLTSYLYLPWVIKPLWSPLVELYGSRRQWVVGAQLALAGLFGLMAWGLSTPLVVAVALVGFLVAAFLSATHDIALDGFYLLALDARQQALFSGIRSTAFRGAMLLGTGGLVMLAGHLMQDGWSVSTSWGVVFAVAAGLLGVLGLWHARMLPYPTGDGQEAAERNQPAARAGMVDVFRSYFELPGIRPLLAFILLFRLGEALLTKMLIPFLRDDRALGGMGLSTSEVGFAYGTVGIGGLVLGGIAGGVLIARYGLRRCLWPLALCLHLPNLGYVYLAWAQPDLAWTTAMIAVEQLGYGLGYAAFTVCILRSVGERFPTAHYALSTGFMALGMMIPGLLSGELQVRVGYPWFFVIASLVTIPGLCLIPFLRLRES